MAKHLNTGTPGMYEIVQVNLLDGSESFLPGDYATEEDALDRIAEHERATGQEPGCDHGFGAGAGAGYRPRLRT